MKTIIAGSRTINDYEIVKKAIKASGIKISTVVSGDAHGVDQLGLRYAHVMGLPSEIYPAQWFIYGVSAGPRRNTYMAEKIGTEALIAVWDGKSRGTKHMIETAKDNGLKVFVYETDEGQINVKN